jgi:hypothetical protein
MKLCIDVAMPALPRPWVRLIWIVIVVLLARLSGAPAEALPLILGGGLATAVAPRARRVAGVS